MPGIRKLRINKIFDYLIAYLPNRSALPENYEEILADITDLGIDAIHKRLKSLETKGCIIRTPIVNPYCTKFSNQYRMDLVLDNHQIHHLMVNEIPPSKLSVAEWFTTKLVDSIAKDDNLKNRIIIVDAIATYGSKDCDLSLTIFTTDGIRAFDEWRDTHLLKYPFVKTSQTMTVSYSHYWNNRAHSEPQSDDHSFNPDEDE